QGGQQVFNGLSFSNSSDVVQSSYGLNLNYRVNSATFVNPKAAVANRDAVDADISGSSEQLRAAVTQQYLSVLQAQARAALQDSLVKTADAQLELAKAKLAVGMGTTLDIRRAEVALGQAQVALLTARNNVEVEKLRLFQQLGVTQPTDVQLTTDFPVNPPTFALDSVLELARRQNPAVLALRSRERAATLNVKVARAEYTPTLSLSTGWGGNSYQYTNAEYLVEQARGGVMGQLASCLSQDSLRTAVGLSSANCNSRYVFTDAQAASIRANNSQFPFRFQRSPLALTASISMPVFDNFNREERGQRVKWSVAGGVVLVVVLIGGLTAAKGKNKAVEVRTEQVQPRDLVASVTASGQVRPQTKVDLSSDITGKIVKLAVKEGQMVTQ